MLKTEKEKTLQDLENKLEIAREIERKVETRLLNKEKLLSLWQTMFLPISII